MFKLFITFVFSGLFYTAILKGFIPFPPNGSAIFAGALSGALCFLSLFIIIEKVIRKYNA